MMTSAIEGVEFELEPLALQHVSDPETTGCKSCATCGGCQGCGKIEM
jgi:hypothetical protein